MKNIFAKLLVLTALLLGCMLLLTAGALGEETIQANMEVRPNVLTGTSTVNVSINIINIGDDPTPLSVSLYDPAGSICAGFGSGGTAYLAPGESQSYTGTWTVTASELEKGRISYTARYSATNSSGERFTASKPFYATIKHNTAKAAMKIDRILPKGSVVENQTVTISYNITNTGTVDILNIQIKDPGINNDVLEYPKLAVGETITLSTSYVAGTSSKTTNATVTYEYVIGDKTEKKTEQAEAKIIDVTVPDLVVDLKASELIVNAGQKVDLTCIITNRSGLSYEQLKVTDKTLNDIESGISLGAGKSHTVLKSITVTQSGTYQFVVSGVDSTGQTVQFTSQEVIIQTTEDLSTVDSFGSEVIPVVLGIVIEADRDIIHSEPSEIIFRVKVTNNGLDTVENVVVSALGPANTSVTVHTIEESIAPGETKEFIKRLTASMGGKYVFSASAKNNLGEEQSHESNPFQVTFQATQPPATPPPTPAPTAAPTAATEPATEEATVPQLEGSTGTGTILLYILAGLLLVILLAVALLFFLDHRRNNPKPPSGYSGHNVVIDSIQRSPHRDYARAPKRGRPNDKRGRKQPEQPLAPAYAPDEDEMYQPPQRPDAPAEDVPRVNMRTFDVEPSAPRADFDTDSVYRRPEAKAPADMDGGLATRPAAAPKPAASAPARNEAMEQTEVYGRDYLSRIRQKAAEEAEAEKPKSAMSDEDAALLSGSTGQYRLSRRAGSVRGNTDSVVRKVEDPEAFTRKQRTTRAADEISNFYDDDDDDDGDEMPSASRRRK